MTIEEFLKSDPATDIITEYYYDNKNIVSNYFMDMMSQSLVSLI